MQKLLVSEDKAAEMIDVSTSSLQKSRSGKGLELIKTGKMPLFINVGGSVKYAVSTLVKFTDKLVADQEAALGLNQSSIDEKIHSNLNERLDFVLKEAKHGSNK